MNERKDYLSWDEYFMGLAELCAFRSKDPNTRVGACLVNKDNKVISLGYNGMPIGCKDKDMPWGRNEDGYLNNKYPFVCHAELNAVLNCEFRSLAGAFFYITLFPCNECAKVIIQSGIKKVIYKEDKYSSSDSVIAAKHMFNMAGVKYERYISRGNSVTLKL